MATQPTRLGITGTGTDEQTQPADQIVEFEGTTHHFPADFTASDISSALDSAHPQPPSAGGYSGLNSVGTAVKDFTAGLGSGVLSTGLGAYNLARKLPGASNALPAPNEYMQGLGRPPESFAGKAGHVAEQAAEYALPGGASKGAGLLTKMGVEGLESAGVGALQSGGDLLATGAAGGG